MRTRSELSACLRCAACGKPFAVSPDLLTCPDCGRRIPVRGGVPRFVPEENYADNFGFQWNKFSATQLDGRNGLTISRDRFRAATGWGEGALKGKLVLDAGCGAGRFAEIAVASGADLIAVDYSGAVDACRSNLGESSRPLVLQADIYDLPFAPGIFDAVYCLGVIQHTPDPAQAFAALARTVKPGGVLVVDAYERSWRSAIHLKYWLRPVTSRMAKQNLFARVEKTVPMVLPACAALASVPVLGRAVLRGLPIAYYGGVYPLDARQLREWAILDTFDMLSPRFDFPQTPATLRAWFEGAGFEKTEILRAGHLVGRGRKTVT